MGVGAAPAKEPMLRIRPFLLVKSVRERGASKDTCRRIKGRGRVTHRETMEGAMRLVMRSVAVTLTLMMLSSSSGDVSTKSAGISWDTPTLLTVDRASGET